MAKDLFKIEITDSKTGNVIGHCTTAEFRKWCERNGEARDQFLGTLVTRFNEWKARIGEPERVRQVFA